MLDAILFDYDGTLGMTQERQHDWFHYWGKLNGKNRLMHPEGGDLSDLKRFIAVYNKVLAKHDVQRFYADLELPCDMNDRTHPVWIAYDSFKLSNPARLYPGIKEAIIEIWEAGQLSTQKNRNYRVRLGINTTNSWDSICKELKAHGILHCFDSYVAKDILAVYDGAGNASSITKPSKISVALSLDVLNSEGRATMHVGDTLGDLKASIDVRRGFRMHKGENLITVGVAWGYECRENLEGGVIDESGVSEHFKHIIESPDQLPKVVASYM
ncbi:HAD family hydrolase [Candidatus Woesearchaeota archaeon]|nr:HAD family hydrolase [Candidatus Woesearchaeota archaeon]